MGMTVSKRVGELEGCMAGLQDSIESVKAEVLRVQNIEKNMAGMIDRFNLLMVQWDEQERERKGKRDGEDQPAGSSLSKEGMPMVGGRSAEGGDWVDGVGRQEYCGDAWKCPSSREMTQMVGSSGVSATSP